MNAKALATTDAQPVGFIPNQENVELLKTTLASAGTTLTDSELQLTIYTATQRGLNPLTRQMYVMKDRGGRISFITSIDGFRLIADRSGKYEGQTPMQWCGGDGVWTDVWLSKEHPAAARVGIWRTGFREALVATATWSSYSKTTGQWPIMGDVMIAKCAEALAFRKAFPEDMSGLYVAEEMDQAKPEREQAEPMITNEQKMNLSIVLNDKAVPKAKQKATLLYFASEHLGKPVTDVGELTHAEAQDVGKALEKTDGEVLTAFFGEGK